MTPADIGQNIRHWRTTRGISQSTLAAALETPTCQISEWENGHKYPSYKSLCALCEALGVTPNELMGQEWSAI